MGFRDTEFCYQIRDLYRIRDGAPEKRSLGVTEKQNVINDINEHNDLQNSKSQMTDYK